MKALLPILRKTKRHPRRHPPKTTGGFTMIELLVGMIIAFLIITPMLAFVVNILDNDVKEQAKSSTEQDLQAALDYIAQDMSQAIHVYSPTDVDTIENIDAADRPIRLEANQDAVLVFWKREYKENAVEISDCTETSTNDCMDDTFVYSLVTYYLVSDDNSTWCQPDGGTCPSRITRIEISKPLPGDTDNGYNSANIGVYQDASQLTKGAGTLPGHQTLVNYIEGFSLNSVSTDNKLAEITIVGNALRRIENDSTCEATPATTPATYKTSAYCPKINAQLGARSGFGTSSDE